MLQISLSDLFVLAFLIAINMRLLNSSQISVDGFEEPEFNNNHRNLDSALHSVIMEKKSQWYDFGVLDKKDDPRDLYLANDLAIFISSNETLLSSGPCSFFEEFRCTSLSCTEDDSILYSQNYTKFSISDATRVRLTENDISIAGGAWKLDSSVLYIYDCNITTYKLNGQAVGQIGLGLGGQGYKNFLSLNPIFSIIFHSMESAELIFGLNSTYVTENSTAIILPCDLDWKMQAHSLTVGDTIIASGPVNMIFDLQTESLTLPAAYYNKVKTYLSSFENAECMKQHYPSFVCTSCDLQAFPVFTFHLYDGTPFTLSPVLYMKKAFGNCYYGTFYLHESPYIVLGRDTMFQHYTVFQQFTNGTAGITLYPHPIDTLPKPKFTLDSYSLTDSSQHVITEHNSVPSNSEPETKESQETSSFKPLPSQEENVANPQTQAEYNGADQTILYIVILIALTILIGIIIVYLMKKRWSKEEEIAERPRSTVELNESSHFVGINVASNDDDEIAE